MTLDPQILREALDSLNKRKARNKYHAKPCTIDGIKFNSQKEAARYQQLRLMEKAGQIQLLKRQLDYPIHVVTPAGELAHAFSYRADFVYFEKRKSNLMDLIVEDCKGFHTAMYKLKRKAFELQYGIKIRET